MKKIYSYVDSWGRPVTIFECDSEPHECLHIKIESKYPENCSGWDFPKYETIEGFARVVILDMAERLEELCKE